METLVRGIVKRRIPVLLLFLVLACLCALLSRGVGVNYDMVKYLPEDAPSTLALDAMLTAFDQEVPNLRVLVPHQSIPQALDCKARIEALEGVTAIQWLDDQISLSIPLETQDQSLIEEWYLDGQALFSVTLDKAAQRESLDAIREIIGDDGAMSGNAVDIVGAQNTASSEVQRIALFVVPIILVILFFTTTSWVEPILFLANVGVAILINQGTNLLFGEISFITQSTGAILLLACSMDYAIFLLDRFGEQRALGLGPEEAMTQAVVRSASSILASGLTTVVGFLALVAMRFKIGPDMGFVLAKGIGIALLTTLVFMPCLTICCLGLIGRTHHRSFLPTFATLARWTSRVKTPITVAVAVLLIPCYLAQQRIPFVYGTAGLAPPSSRIFQDRQAIEAVFGEAIPFVLLVPEGSAANEQRLCADLKAMPDVTSVLSYGETVGKEIPADFLPAEIREQFSAGGYSRIILSARLPTESARTFAFVRELRETAQRYYPQGSQLVGEAVNVYDIKQTIEADSTAVNLIAIGAIAVILLFTFRSVTLPILLLVTIESSIFINVAIPYFMGSSFNYIGFLIISSIQLGATIDYAILFTNRYYENRAALPRKETVFRTIQNTAASILTSAGIMTSAGLVLGLISTNSVISQLGILVARGAVLSAVLVLVMLPTLLSLCEPLIQKTSLGLKLFETAAKSAKEVPL